MKLLLLAALGALVYAQSTPPPVAYADRRCGDDLSNLWLDIVAVVDNSLGMTRDGLQAVAANIVSVFSSGTVIGIQPGLPKTTRVGVVTYNQDSTINAMLDTFTSIDDLYDNVYTYLGHVSNTDESYLIHGLNAAEQVFQNGSIPSRAHYKRVVIVYASTYQGTGTLNPVPAADRLKSTGVTIVTVAYSQDRDETLVAELKQIASPNDNFSNTDENVHLLGEIQGALLQANCFCPDSWVQYRSSFTDVFSYRYGVCIRGVGLNAVWRASKISCRNFWPNAFLVAEYNQHKHDYVFDVVRNMTGMFQPYSYHIGLNLQSGKYVWEQPVGVPPVPLQDWSDWNPGYPKLTSTLAGVMNLQPSQVVQTGWINVDAMRVSGNYVCEVATCDTDNYCDKVNDNLSAHAKI